MCKVLYTYHTPVSPLTFFHIKFNNYQNKKHNSQASFKNMERDLRLTVMKAHNPLTYQKASERKDTLAHIMHGF